MVHCINLASKTPQPNVIECPWDGSEPIHGGPTFPPTRLWCQTPQRTIRGPVFMPRQVSAESHPNQNCNKTIGVSHVTCLIPLRQCTSLTDTRLMQQFGLIPFLAWAEWDWECPEIKYRQWNKSWNPDFPADGRLTSWYNRKVIQTPGDLVTWNFPPLFF